MKLESGSDKFNSETFSVAASEPANKPGKYQGKCEICISRVGAVQPNIAAPPNSNIDMLLQYIRLLLYDFDSDDGVDEDFGNIEDLDILCIGQY